MTRADEKASGATDDRDPPVVRLEAVDSDRLSREAFAEILALCAAAYGEDLAPLFRAYGPGTHILARIDGALVSHAMWVTRRLRPGDAAEPLRTAYVEAVATLPAHEGRGYASEVMRRLAAEVPASYALAALSPATPRFYERLGWRHWRGQLGIRMPDGRHQPTPEESVMVLELPGRPPLDLDAALSAEWREGEVW